MTVFSFKKVRNLNLFTLVLLSAVVVTVPVCAQNKTTAEISADAAIKETLTENANKTQTATEAMYQDLGKKLVSDMNKSNSVTINLYAFKKRMQQASIGFMPFLRGLIHVNPAGNFSTNQATSSLNEEDAATNSGHTTIEGDPNLSNFNRFSNEASLQKVLDNDFCIPTSLNASEECKARAKGSDPSNFIDFFLSEKTWLGARMSKEVILARVYFANLPDLLFIGQGDTDASTYISNQSAIARSGLRMAIINNLAARRAPTAEVTDGSLSIFLKTFATTRDVTSNSYEKVCAKKDPTPVEFYACALTAANPKAAVGKPANRLISQAALDKIIQFDFMLSPLLYDQINSGKIPAEGPMEKMEVLIKAQQLAQDYRALRLLQMKVAATALNMMNKK